MSGFPPSTSQYSMCTSEMTVTSLDHSTCGPGAREQQGCMSKASPIGFPGRHQTLQRFQFLAWNFSWHTFQFTKPATPSGTNELSLAPKICELFFLGRRVKNHPSVTSRLFLCSWGPGTTKMCEVHFGLVGLHESLQTLWDPFSFWF